MKSTVRFSGLWSALAVPMLVWSLLLPSVHASGEYILATASTGGTYYPVGVAIATLVKSQLSTDEGISMRAVPTAGSVENLDLLRDGKADFAILQALVGHDVWNGRGFVAGKRKWQGFRAVTVLWRNVEQFVIRAEHLRGGTVDDLRKLRGARVALGSLNSGTLVSSRLLLRNLGIDVDHHFELVHMGYGPAASALQAGDVQAISVPSGLPTKSLSRAKSSMGSKIAILAFTPAQAARADAGLGLWSPFSIPAGTYPAQPNVVTTIAQPNLLAVSEAVPAEVVSHIARTIFEHRNFLRSMHPATSDIGLTEAFQGLPVPLHAGASHYFESVGLDIPTHLVPR
jgi:TRAP transporter TAXI family solute receptor